MSAPVTLQYVGPTPANNAVLAPKSFADAQAAAAVVTSSYVNAQIADTAALLTTPTYVNNQNALLATQASVNNALAECVPLYWMGVPYGVATLNGSTQVPGSQVPPTTPSDRISLAYATAFASGALGQLGGVLSSVTGAVGTPEIVTPTTVTSNAARTLLLAQVEVEDPGYPWLPLPFGWVMGNSSGATSKPASRNLGTGNYGLLTVLPPSTVGNQVYGMGICTGSYYSDHYPVLPYAGLNQTPQTVPPITGSMELQLYGQLWSGSTYTFLPDDLAFWVMVVPALPWGSA